MSARNGSAAVADAAEAAGRRGPGPPVGAAGPAALGRRDRPGQRLDARPGRPRGRRPPGRCARTASPRRALGLTAELAKVAAGRSEVEPPKGDRRFKDPAWEGNPAFRRLAQAYLATARTADDLVGDADAGWRAERRVRYVVGNVADALAPTNFPPPTRRSLKATLDTGGRNFVDGARHLASRHGHAAAHPGDGRQDGLRGRARTSRSRRARSSCARRCSSSSTTGRRRRRCASCRCWSCRR